MVDIVPHVAQPAISEDGRGFLSRWGAALLAYYCILLAKKYNAIASKASVEPRERSERVDGSAK